MKKNLNKVEISGIRKFFNMAEKYENVVSLTLGEPDFNLPKVVEEGIIDALKENKTKYTSNKGIIELRREISKYLKNKYNINFNEEEICITIGGSEAIQLSICTEVDEDDYVLLPNPGFPAYENVCKLAGAKILYYGFNEDFSINFDDVNRALLKNPKVIVLNFPSNPIGTILTKEDRDKFVEILKDKDIKIVSDEIYADLLYDTEFYSVSQCEEIISKVILISGFSKNFSMTGLRLGYIAAKGESINNIVKVHQYFVSTSPSITQYGAIMGLKEFDITERRNIFKERRNFVVKRLKEMGFDINMPKGAFYAFPSIKKYGMKSEEFCERLLDNEKLAIVPGNAFGSKGDDYIRISYAADMETLKVAMERLQKFVDSIK